MPFTTALRVEVGAGPEESRTRAPASAEPRPLGPVKGVLSGRLGPQHVRVSCAQLGNAITGPRVLPDASPVRGRRQAGHGAGPLETEHRPSTVSASGTPPSAQSGTCRAPDAIHGCARPSPDHHAAPAPRVPSFSRTHRAPSTPPSRSRRSCSRSAVLLAAVGTCRPPRSRAEAFAQTAGIREAKECDRYRQRVPHERDSHLAPMGTSNNTERPGIRQSPAYFGYPLRCYAIAAN